MEDLEGFADALKELGDSQRSIALALGLLAVRMSSADSDTVVIRVPSGLPRLKPEAPSPN
jgi:hypothetical protein